jgi:predicted transcriptional regulator
LRSVSKKKLSDQNLININRLILRNPETTVKKLIYQLNLNVARSTLNKYINALGRKKVLTK